MRPRIFAHGSYIGTTGYNHHTRDFFRELSKSCDIKFRNFTVGSTWSGYSKTPHDNEPYIDDLDKKLLYKQILFNSDNSRRDYDIYPHSEKDFTHDLNIVLCETDHYIFYDNYNGPKIAYNVWESTLQPEGFFNKLKEFDELWVPSKWQRDCTIKQGYDTDKIKVVPEGVDDTIFFPEKTSHKITDNCFSFFLAGRWDYRKSTKEIIESFIDVFKDVDNVKLILSVDNPFSNDNLKTTEERLTFYGLNDPKIEILHFPSREDYIKILKSCNVFLSCARSEGWNLPLIESMASGVPSIYSDCSGQLEFAEGKGIPVKILGELPANNSNYNHFNTTVGNYYEPDFDDLKKKMLDVYYNYTYFKSKALFESKLIRDNFSWDVVSKIGYDTIQDFLNRKPWLNKPIIKNKIVVSYLDGPKVEILGDEYKEYIVEFLDETDNVIHRDKIYNNMWCSCSRKYYTAWSIRVNGEIIDRLNLENQRVLISLESKSVGDTLAWSPYVVEFAEKHKCKVVLSTFHNGWFKGLNEYNGIEFIEPGKSTNCYVVYRIGWFRDENGGWKKFDSYPNQVNLIPLQKTATDILGLEFHELNYGVNYKPSKRIIREKYIVIGPQSTAGCKEWSYDNWVQLSDMLIKSGYKVISLTSSPFKINGVKNISNSDWQNVFNVLHHSEFFIGLASGLSWLNWALGKKTVMISGFSEEGHEFTRNLIRVSKNICIKCWNDPVFTFDAGDWNWCPVYKGTERQHICQKSITPLDVFSKLPFDSGFEWGNSSEWYIKTITEEIFKNKIYERFFEVSENDTVLDLGSSIGPFAYSLKDKKIKHIYCLEPSVTQIPTLEKNTSNIPSTIINKGIGDSNGSEKFLLFGQKNNFGKSESITFKTLLEEYNINNLDFIKTDCEGGEYSVFNNKNLEWIKSNVKKISGEWHLSTPELKDKFREFRDSFLKYFTKYEVYSVDGIDIKWDLQNEHFIEYYNEIIVYIDNR
jgi:autotransporter strand-loop-strand O-heptosyltransferase